MWHHLRSRVTREPLIAHVVSIPSPAVVEIVSSTAFPAILIDAEHGPFSISDIETAIRVADGKNTPTIVRVPETGSYIPRVLDAGAQGIVVPRVESAEEAADVVRRARYAPQGARGAGAGRGAGYGPGMFEFVSQSNEQVLVAVQIETVLGLNNAEGILSVPGIDAVVLGPFDLATSMGVAMGSPEHSAALARIFAVAEQYGVAKGAFSFSAADTARLLAEGATLIFAGSDVGSLYAGAEREWAAISPHLPGDQNGAD